MTFFTEYMTLTKSQHVASQARQALPFDVIWKIFNHIMQTVTLEIIPSFTFFFKFLKLFILAAFIVTAAKSYAVLNTVFYSCKL